MPNDKNVIVIDDNFDDFLVFGEIFARNEQYSAFPV